MQDRHVELLDGERLRAAKGETAWFNGDAIRVRLYAGAKTRAQFFALRNLATSHRPAQTGPLTLCGVDNRRPYTEKRVGRVVIKEGSKVFIGSAWLLKGHPNGFLSAGHNLGGASLTSITVEFNVPASDANGNAKHPAPKDQYLWAGKGGTNSAFENAGLGKDWSVFKTLVNSTTKKHAGAVQGSGYTLAAPPRPLGMLLISGFGFDTTPKTSNFTNQLASGPWVMTALDELRHRVDTMGGNSGSPVVDSGLGAAIAVHTNGGCDNSSTSYNTGTTVTQLAFYEARIKVLNAARCNYVAKTLKAGTSSIVPGQPVKLTATVANLGTVPGPRSEIRYYFSRDSKIDASDTLLAKVPTVPLENGKSYLDVRDVIAPQGLGTGTYYFGVTIDVAGKITETNEADNSIAIPVSYTKGKVDLAVTLIGGWHNSIVPGQTITWTTAAANNGTAWSPESRSGIFMSGNKTLSTSDNFLGYVTFPPIKPKSVHPFAIKKSVQLPHCLSIGNSYYFFGWIDYEQKIPESNETNNVLFSGSKTYPQPLPKTLRRIEYRPRVGTITESSYSIATASAKAGGQARMCLIAPGLLKHWYLCVWSGSPNFQFDLLTNFSLMLTNTPMLQGFLGKTSSSSGRAKPILNLPPAAVTGSLTIYSSAFFFSPDFSKAMGSTGNSIKLVIRG